MNEPVVGDYASGITRDEVAPYDKNTYGSYMQRSEAYYQIYDTPNYWYTSKSASTAQNMPSQKQYKLNYNVSSYAPLTNSVWNDQYLSTYSLYDILPEGVYADPTAITAYFLRTSSGNSAGIETLVLQDGTKITTDAAIQAYLTTRTTVDIDNNYQGSGRTKVTIGFDLSDNPIDLDETIKALNSQTNMYSSYLYLIYATIPVIIPYDSIDTYGGVVKNNVYASVTAESLSNANLPNHGSPVADDVPMIRLLPISMKMGRRQVKK